MNNLFQVFEFISAYIDYLLISSKGYLKYHVQKLESTLNKLKDSGLTCNIKKSFFVQTQMEYFGFCVTHDDLKPIDKKSEAIKIMMTLTSWK